MTPKQEAALRLALEALELNCSSQTESPATKAITAIDEALAEQPAQVDPCIDGSCSCCWTHLDEQPAQQQSMEPYSTLNLKATPISGWGQQPIGMSINAEAADWDGGEEKSLTPPLDQQQQPAQQEPVETATM